MEKLYASTKFRNGKKYISEINPKSMWRLPLYASIVATIISFILIYGFTQLILSL